MLAMTLMIVWVLGQKQGNGQATAQDPSPPKVPLAWDGAKQDGPTLLKEIAAARVAMDVEGDLAAVETRLDALWKRAAEIDGYEGQVEVLVQVALARAELFRRLGEREKAVRATEQVLLERVDVGGRVELESEYVPATGNLLVRVYPLVVNDVRLASFRTELARDTAEDQGAQSEQASLSQLVRDLYKEMAYEDILAIGPAAIEPFAAEIAAGAGTLVPADSDPLHWLVEMDQRRVARALLAHFEDGGPFWKRRVLRAMTFPNGGDVLGDSGTWTNNEPYLCLEPEWLELLERLLVDPDTAKDALPFLVGAEMRDALTPGLCAALAQGLARLGPDFATAVVQILDHPGVVNSARPVLEAVLGNPDVILRRFAAEKLVNYPRSEALLAHAGDADAEVRQRVAEALVAEGGDFYRFAVRNIQPVKRRAKVLGPDVPVVLKLLGDPVDEVRETAVYALDVLETPLEPERYEALARDRSTAVRRQLAWTQRMPGDTRARVLAQLARDPAPEVVGSLDRLLQEKSRNNGNPGTSELALNPGPYLGALEARFADKAAPMDSDLWRAVVRCLCETAEGTRALVTWTLAAPTPDAVRRLAEGARTELLVTLPNEYLARLLATSERDTGGPWERLWHALGEAKPRPTAAMRLLLVNPQASRLVRLSAATRCADGSAPFREAFVALLRDPSWKERPLDGDELGRIQASADKMPATERVALALALVRDDAVRPEVADAFVHGYPFDTSGSRALTEAVLERWFRPEVPYRDGVETALTHLGALPDLDRADVLEQALRRPEYGETAIRAMAGRGDPRFLPALGRCLKAEWIPPRDRDEFRVRAAEAISSFNDERAIEFLLEGLRSTDDTMVSVCQEGLNRLENYRRRSAAWREHAVAAPTKESALAELVALLADADPLLRKQAALGLGSLGAKETLPQLIRLLKDTDAGVRAAAQQAIDRLNAPPSTGETVPNAPTKEG